MCSPSSSSSTSSDSSSSNYDSDSQYSTETRERLKKKRHYQNITRKRNDSSSSDGDNDADSEFSSVGSWHSSDSSDSAGFRSSSQSSTQLFERLTEDEDIDSDVAHAPKKGPRWIKPHSSASPELDIQNIPADQDKDSDESFTEHSYNDDDANFVDDDGVELSKYEEYKPSKNEIYAFSNDDNDYTDTSSKSNDKSELEDNEDEKHTKKKKNKKNSLVYNIINHIRRSLKY